MRARTLKCPNIDALISWQEITESGTREHLLAPILFDPPNAKMKIAMRPNASNGKRKLKPIACDLHGVLVSMNAAAVGIGAPGEVHLSGKASQRAKRGEFEPPAGDDLAQVIGEVSLVLSKPDDGICTLVLHAGMKIRTATSRSLAVFLLRGAGAWDQIYLEAGAGGFLDLGLRQRLEREPPATRFARWRKKGQAAASMGGIGRREPRNQAEEKKWMALSGWGGVEQLLDSPHDF